MCIHIGRDMDIFTLEKVDSTNNYVKNNLDKLDDRTVVRALRQTSGRGRLSRSWVDLGEGNVFLSFVLKPSASFNEIYSNLTQYLSVILCKLLEKYGLKPQIKWPNDVLISGKKIAGILSETVVQGTKCKGIVLGIGINLNAQQEDINMISDKIATSLNIELKSKINAEGFINELVELFYKDYDEFLKKGFEFIKSEYIARAYFLGSEITVKGFSDSKSGLAKEINSRGELILEKDNKEFVLTIGDIL